MTTALTRVAILFLPGQANDRVRFGAPVSEAQIDRRRAVAHFEPGALFGYVQWRANGFGTELWRAYVLRAGSPGERLFSVPGVTPGADILVSTSGGARANRLLALVDAMEAADVAPHDAPESYWRVVQNRLASGLPLRTYAPAEHGMRRASRDLAP